MPKRKTQSSESQPYQHRKRAGKQPPLIEPPSAPSTTDYPEVQMNLAPELPQSIPGPSYTLGAQETPPVQPLPPHQLQDLAERISTILKDRGSPQSQEEDLETSNQPGVLSQQLNQPQTVTEPPFPCMLDVSNVACIPIKVPVLSKYLAKYPIRESESQPYQHRKRAGKQPPLIEPPSAPSTTDYPEVQMNLAPELPQSIPGPSYTLGAQETPPVQPLPPHQLQDLAERISTILKDRGSPQSQEEDTRIWIVGSSIIKRAFCQTRHSIFQTHLELERHRATIFWQVWPNCCPTLFLFGHRYSPTSTGEAVLTKKQWIWSENG
uniref:Uncharacterized protein n=1 Tax=Magallana gigas TaxID=29159 RepID=A0A8W8IJ90_MAGGI